MTDLIRLLSLNSHYWSLFDDPGRGVGEVSPDTKTVNWKIISRSRDPKKTLRSPWSLSPTKSKPTGTQSQWNDESIGDSCFDFPFVYFGEDKVLNSMYPSPHPSWFGVGVSPGAGPGVLDTLDDGTYCFPGDVYSKSLPRTLPLQKI